MYRSRFSKELPRDRKRKVSQQPPPAEFDRTGPQAGIIALQRAAGNRATEELLQSGKGASPATDEKSVNGRDERVIGDIVERDPAGGGGGGGAAAPAKAKKAGVDSFKVEWSENPITTATSPRLYLEYKAKFKDDDEHDPALAEFRQNVMTKYEITDGPNKGQKADTSPMHDDNYSRADDDYGRSKSNVNFSSNDNPGLKKIDKDDYLKYSFTAEQMIIDTSQGNKVLEKVGPKTGTIEGKHPRKFTLPDRC